MSLTSNLIVAVIFSPRDRILFPHGRQGSGGGVEGGSGRDPHHVERAVLPAAHQGNHFVPHLCFPSLLAERAPTGSWSHNTDAGATQTRLQSSGCSPSAKQGSRSDVCNEEKEERKDVRRRSTNSSAQFQQELHAPLMVKSPTGQTRARL